MWERNTEAITIQLRSRILRRRRQNAWELGVRGCETWLNEATEIQDWFAGMAAELSVRSDNVGAGNGAIAIQLHSRILRRRRQNAWELGVQGCETWLNEATEIQDWFAAMAAELSGRSDNLGAEYGGNYDSATQRDSAQAETNAWE